MRRRPARLVASTPLARLPARRSLGCPHAAAAPCNHAANAKRSERLSASGSPEQSVAEPIRIVVLEGDETGQELLEQSLRVLDPALLALPIELERFDLSLENRRATSNQVVQDAAAAMLEAGLGLKAATITPEGAGDVGSPNRILREAVGGRVIIRTGRRLPGVTPIAAVHFP